MEFRPATDTDRDAWQAFLEMTSAGDFLHDWAWADVAAFDGQPQRRYLLLEDDVVVAIAAAQERSLVAGRTFWYVPRGPVLDWSSPQAAARLRSLLIGLRIAAKQHRAVAVMLEPRLASGDPAAALIDARGLRHTPDTLQVGQTRLVELADDEALLAGFDKDTRYGVRRAAREGVTVTVVEGATDATAIDALHGLVRRDAATSGLPDAPARALSGRMDGIGRCGTCRHPRGAPRGAAPRIGHGRDRGAPVVLPVQRIASRGARRAEALRQLCAAVGDDAIREGSRRDRARSVGSRASGCRSRNTPGTASASSRRGSVARRWCGPAAGISSSTRRRTACGAPPA